MSDKNPCPFCWGDSDYLRFLELCAERANEIWHENEVKTMIGVYTSMGFVQVVRCRDCKYFECLINDSYVCSRNEKFKPWIQLDGFCAWGERK